MVSLQPVDSQRWNAEKATVRTHNFYERTAWTLGKDVDQSITIDQSANVDITISDHFYDLFVEYEEQKIGQVPFTDEEVLGTVLKYMEEQLLLQWT